MKWSTSKLANYIKNSVSGKDKITLQDGSYTPATNEVINGISNGLASNHSSWQDSVRINNVLVNGGTCTAGGPLAAPATGIALIGTWSTKISGNGIKSSILGNFPGNNIVELTPNLQALCIATATGFATTFNQWLDTTIISNIIVTGGSCSCQAPPGSPVGSYSGGKGQLPLLEGNISIKLSKSLLENNITIELNNQLKLSQSGSPTPDLLQFVDAISDGIINMQSEWLIGTQIKNVQVNGGTSIFSGPLIASQGQAGELK